MSARRVPIAGPALPTTSMVVRIWARYSAQCGSLRDASPAAAADLSGARRRGRRCAAEADSEQAPQRQIAALHAELAGVKALLKS
ncbi:hypothetical protein RM423_08950 [Jatrophihabitans sp. DSM 44399]|uniref:Uncharacterized protein n=1 Tax=Jatrophihabitans lederbergiae TaxID=3075547 RepID=A0ABU2J953_9ACTN|nr:hypothetical protein [Jatrophihabitans sp. DSM 44399]MDT0261520.1 hypothetical protein [Jatrophihabitans sp. DSM 44399]